MKILISNVPPQTNADSLRTLVQQTRNLHRLSYLLAPPELVQCRVVRITEPETQATRYYGLLVVRPEEAAEKLIKQLDGKKLNGQVVEARQYHDRAPTDRRRVTTSADEKPANLTDNRRKDLIIEALLDEATQSLWEKGEEE